MLLTPYEPYSSKCQVISKPGDVTNRLLQLHPSLDENVLLDANSSGYAARLETTLAHAPTAAGTLHWHWFVAALRMALKQKDWHLENHKNSPLIVSPDKGIMISVMTGDEDTGRPLGIPRNQAEKGNVLSQAILQNELFDNSSEIARMRGDLGTQLWVLLYCVERDFSDPNQIRDKEIRTELSLPSKFENGKIVGWAERIILRSIPLEPMDQVIAPVPVEPIDVPVQRRSEIK